MSVLNGSTQEALTWRYTLPSSAARTTRFRIIKGASALIGSIFHGTADPYKITDKDYQTRFNISRSEVATLIINKVTEREEAVYQCELETEAGFSWRYNIRVLVTGKNCNVQIVDDKRSQSINRSSMLIDINRVSIADSCRSQLIHRLASIIIGYHFCSFTISTDKRVLSHFIIVCSL